MLKLFILFFHWFLHRYDLLLQLILDVVFGGEGCFIRSVSFNGYTLTADEEFGVVPFDGGAEPTGLLRLHVFVQGMGARTIHCDLHEYIEIHPFVLGVPHLDLFISHGFLIECVRMEHQNLKTLLCIAFLENAKLCIVLRS